jgi:hypothetical protein
MGSKNKAPPPPDPRQTSAAQTGTNVSTAIANANLTNMNEYTPWGTRTVTQTGDYTWTDPYTGSTYNVPRYSAETTLTPEQQAIFDQNQTTEFNLSSLANERAGFLGDYLGDQFSYNPEEHVNWATGLYDSINGDRMQQQQGTLEAQLVNRGIQPGTEMWDREMDRVMGTQENARNQFLLDSYGQGFNTALTERNQPLNEIIGLMSGTQVSMPQFTTTPNVQGMPTTDNAAIINNNYQQQLAAWQQNQAAAGGLFGGLGQLASGLGGLGLFGKSDENLKTDIRRIGETANGLGIYSYRFKGSPRTEIGLIAQEVQKVVPDAVMRHPTEGYLMVNYAAALEG